VSLRTSHAWLFGWPAASLYAAILNPALGVIVFCVGAWLTWRLR
jgi:hypothetical protein